ncbi:AraC-type DNA-binding protein [Methylobacterium sp. 174MFSha1.1]|uniref:AraC family transcriptional regulator n=1 Tax=Methylobacterium sp. 174MFSha1.1 TaxID=1502749 RepID=UPI0008F404DA|nr:AraC family transcriptional regulator [Methylobacterium sp. 174MFSha1.1]SFV13813.1 AraC-type DNA-binding protein [Methylobacterium sp. 174MFSha1.1]
MSAYGLTRARTVGTIARAVSEAGGSPARLFGRTGLPLTLLETPDRLILLRDQLALVEAAVREVGDPALPARLSMQAGIAGLGPIGAQVRSAGTLDVALRRVETVTPLLLQTATWTGVRQQGEEAFYGYHVTERIESGRQTNEILALGYLLGTARHFLGPAWRPERAMVTGASLPGRAEIEARLGCEVSFGPRAGLVFPARHLNAGNPDRLDPTDRDPAEAVPIGGDLAACVVHLIELGLDEARPSIDDIARRLGLSRRTLQRRLDEAGTGFADLRRGAMLRRAEASLSAESYAIGRIALELGYSDAAHFSRAFLEWTGATPSQWRRSLRAKTRSRHGA